MIIFFHKATGSILGSIDGRVHTKQELNCLIKPDDVPLSQVGKWILSMEKDRNLILDLESGVKNIHDCVVVRDCRDQLSLKQVKKSKVILV